MTLSARVSNALHEYQRTDLDVIVRRFTAGETAVPCEWDPGLGKSLLAIAVCQTLEAPRMLILCPPIACISWDILLKDWWPEVDFIVMSAAKDYRKIRPKHRVVVCPFTALSDNATRAWLRDWAQYSLITIDEAQYLRGPTSQRTGLVYGVEEGAAAHAGPATKVLLLSGTFVVSWADDLWTHLARWEPERIAHEGVRMSYETFRDRFYVTRRVPIPGAFTFRTQIAEPRRETADELRTRLQGWRVVRRKDEVDLPPLIWQTMPLNLTDADRAAMDTELNAKLPDRVLRLARAALRAPDDEELADRLAAAIDDYEGLSAVAMRILGVGKARALARYLDDMMQNDPFPVGVFALNHAVMDILDAALQKHGVVRIDGSTSDTKRAQAVRDFMRPDGPRVFNGQIQACSTALTLVRANRVFFPQLSWIPGENFQAASRFHRHGQRHTVHAIVPFVPGTLDQPQMMVLRRKTQAAHATL